MLKGEGTSKTKKWERAATKIAQFLYMHYAMFSWLHDFYSHKGWMEQVYFWLSLQSNVWSKALFTDQSC